MAAQFSHDLRYNHESRCSLSGNVFVLPGSLRHPIGCYCFGVIRRSRSGVHVGIVEAQKTELKKQIPLRRDLSFMDS